MNQKAAPVCMWNQSPGTASYDGSSAIVEISREELQAKWKDGLITLPLTDLVALRITGHQSNNPSAIVDRRLDALVDRHTVRGDLLVQTLVHLSNGQQQNKRSAQR